MADSAAQPEALPVDTLFRPAKRRRHYRKRADGVEPEDLNTLMDGTRGDIAVAGPSSSKQNTAENQEDDTIKATEKLRLRQHARNRRGGIEFVNGVRDMSIASGASPPSEAGPERDSTSEEVAGLANRFAPQTGQVADVNKHMMAYIESELTRLRQGSSETALAGTGNTSSGEAMLNTSRVRFPQRQPATLGKLHEIDLGPDARLTNIAKTEAAKKKMEASEDEDPTGGTTKVRLGKDGKPWRGRKARTSDDLKRDKLVEEVLRETRLEIYDEHEQETNPDDTQAADDRIAEQFRRDFLDAISSRQRRRTGGARTAPKGVKRDDRPRGPKLGGSRSARAAMRERQEKAGKR